MKKPAESETDTTPPPPPKRPRSILPRASEAPAADDAGLGNNIWRRDRLLASIALIMGAGVILAIPFALRAGAEFFLPVTAALIIAIALVPLLEWFERRGLPSALSSLFCVLIFLAVMAFALLSIVIPATDWVAL